MAMVYGSNRAPASRFLLLLDDPRLLRTRLRHRGLLHLSTRRILAVEAAASIGSYVKLRVGHRSITVRPVCQQSYPALGGRCGIIPRLGPVCRRHENRGGFVVKASGFG